MLHSLVDSADKFQSGFRHRKPDFFTLILPRHSYFNTHFINSYTYFIIFAELLR